MTHKFSLSIYGGNTSIGPKIFHKFLWFSLEILKFNFEFAISIANDVAYDVAKCMSEGKVIQKSPNFLT